MDLSRVLVSVSWCASHWKGANPGEGARIHGETHARWLKESVKWYKRRRFFSIVACTDYHGILRVNTSPDDGERQVLWTLIRDGVPIMGEAHNPGHQVGAAQCIRIGLEYAAYCGYDYLVHTAEDVFPNERKMYGMIAALQQGAHYAGSRWGWQLGRDELNSQFFAARVCPLVNDWDACAVSGHGCIERYLRVMIGDRLCEYMDEPYYRTTHDFEEWQRWREEDK